ncbi:MAG: NADPH-dependent FMN reductase [Cypionkella sp.]
MQLLAISGSLRAASTNTALLRALDEAATPPLKVTLFQGLVELPLFSPDHEANTPATVLAFAAAIGRADGLIIACPEYIHALPGAFKNALDWLVSRPELIGKPIALLHASHRGDDVLADLRRVLATVSDRFAPDIFARFGLGKLTPTEVAAHMAQPTNRAALQAFLARFADFIAEANRPG